MRVREIFHNQSERQAHCRCGLQCEDGIPIRVRVRVRLCCFEPLMTTGIEPGSEHLYPIRVRIGVTVRVRVRFVGLGLENVFEG